MKKKYDSSVIFLYNTGNEKLLNPEFRKKIPHSTINRWRKLNFDSYFGHEYRALFDGLLDNAILQNKYKEQQKLMSGILRSWLSIASTLKPLIKKAGRDKKLQKTVLDAIHYLKDSLGIEKALKLFGVSRSLYYQWILETRYHCFDSYLALCAKRHPQQLVKTDVILMKKLLLNPSTSHWPISSLCMYASRENKLVACRNTWSKYAKLLGITNYAVKKRRKKTGIVSTHPNEYLHVDCTYYPIITGQNVCIAFVMDNYSRMILGFDISESRTFSVVKKALENALEIIVTHPNHDKSFLVADGGTENHNTTIDSFIANLTNHKITKVRALRDIKFSNSPVEAINRIIKGRYLRNRQFESIRALHDYLTWAVLDYNELRPHYKHGYKTPMESYFNTPLRFDIKMRMQRARRRRVKKNKCVGCLQCGEFCLSRR